MDDVLRATESSAPPKRLKGPLSSVRLASWEQPLFLLSCLVGVAGLVMFLWGAPVQAQTEAKDRIADRNLAVEEFSPLGPAENPGGFSQTLSVHLDGVPLERALLQIAESAGLRLSYGSEAVEGMRVELNLHEVTPRQAVEAVLEGTGLAPSFSQNGRVIVAPSANRSKAGISRVPSAPVENDPVRTSTDFATETVSVAAEQTPPVRREPTRIQHEVTGVVTGAEQGSPLPGVNVVVQGTQIGTTTRSDGSYSLEAPSPTDSLVFSFVGYQEQVVPIDSRSEVDVQLQPAVTALEEVVVNVGYQEQTVATTTGSVSQISGEDLEIEPTTNLTQTLQGTVPGVFGVTSTGRPGFDNSNLLIRGSATLNNNSPLVVIDGVPGRQGGLARLNPSDIESVSVLKDASAAIYGSRAANGVILVETKRGSTGETQVNVNVEQSYIQPTVIPEMADAPTYMQMLNEIDQYRGNQPRFSQEEIDNHRGDLSDSWEFHDTDWFEEAIADFSQQSEANASVTGGVEDLRYRVSLRGVTEGGIFTNSGMRFNQFGFRSNLDGDITEALALSLNLHGRLESRETPAWTRSGLDTAWDMIQWGKPFDCATWPNGKPCPAREQGIQPMVADRTGYDDRDQYYFQSSLSLKADIPVLDEWSAEGTVAYDQSFLNRKRWQNPWLLYHWDGSRDDSGEPILTAVESGPPEPRLQQWNETARDVLLRATTSYETSIGNHTGSVLIGSEYQEEEGQDMSAFRRFFPTDEIDLLFAGGQAQRANDGGAFHSARLNFFGRANYDYREKYLLEFVARYDGSYIFPKGDRFGFFPAVSAGWRLAQEEWFIDFSGGFFDRLKLRASYGQSGNDRIEPYQYLRTFGFNGQHAFIDGLAPRIAPTRVPNSDISWEVATQFDAGLQGAILGEKLTFDFTYFNHFRDDILWFRSEAVPAMAGFSLPRENIGQVRSRGVEGQVNYTQNITSDITVRAGANLSWAEDEIEFFAEPEGRLPWQRATGKPMNTELYYIADGIWSTQQEIDNNPSWPGARPGDVRFKDINGDGEINGADRRRIEENGRPDLMGAFNLGATIGQFDARLQFQGAAQVRKYVFAAAGERGNFFQQFADRRWTPENKDAIGPRSYNRVDPYWAQNQNTYFLRDGKYLRLRSARLNYTVPPDWSEQFGFEQFQVYLSGRNLLTWTPLEVHDPEGAPDVYPPERTFAMGVQLGF